LLRGAPKRNAEGTPLRVLSKHGSDLVLVRDEEAAGFRFCHPDHSSRSLTCGNAVSCAPCSIPQQSPQRPRGNKWNAGATATGRRTPAAQHDEADHAAQQGPFRALCSSVNNEVGFQGGTSASQESVMPLFLLPFISSAFVPLATMPTGVRWFAQYQPFTSIIDTLRGLLMGAPIGNSAVIAIAWCIAITLAGYLWARTVFNRGPAQ